MAIVALEGMRFFAHHGVFEHEKVTGNHFVVDVWADTGELPLPESDEVADVPDYGKIYTVVLEEMAIRRNLLETLVVKIGNALCAQFPEMEQFKVRVAKENPPLGGECARSYVEAVIRPNR
jgi:7,8-dihydroneopterin aldolase/epimerase/oxygenase